MLTQKQENFCTNIVLECMTQHDAYIAAYNTGKMLPATIDRNAHFLVEGNNKIATRIQELRKRVEDETVGDLNEACQISTAIMRAKISDFTDESGRIDKTKLDSHAIQSIDEVSTMAGTAVITKLRLNNPLDGIEKLARLKKWYEPTQIINNDIKILVVYDNRAEKKEE